ncbi:MAG: hypothetical protein LBU65_05800, partial [Planctomycetaceae bacterium]|nr:hypothetical protein [Planctomycetaceae bacterium]
MKKLLFRVVFCVFSLTALFVSQLFAAEYRTWTDVTGEHEVEAMLLDSDGKEVKLKRKDNGKIVTMSLNKLSLADRAEVKRTLGSSSDDSDDDNKHGKVSASSGMKPGLVKFSKIRELRTKNAGTTWSVEPDPAKVAKLDYVPDELAFQLKKQEYNVHKTGENFFFCDDIPDRVLGVTHLSQNSKRQTVVFVGDLKKSSVKSNILPVDLEPFGLTPNGKLALFRQKIDGERLSSSEQVLVISDVEDTKFRCLQVIEPFTKMGKESRTDIRWAAWADNNNIIAMAASNDNVVLFNMDDLTAVWSYPLLGTERPEFSPGRKYVVLPSKDGLFLVETLTGNVIGKFKFPTETNRFLSMTF